MLAQAAPHRFEHVGVRGVVDEIHALQRVCVQIVELFGHPRHPYSIGLFRSLPDLAAPGERLATIPGMVPPATRFPSGCRFRTRCTIASELCAREEPPLVPLDGDAGHTVACHHLEEADKL